MDNIDNQQNQEVSDKKETNHSFSLENVIYHMIKNERFYANFLLNTTVVYDHPKVPTAGASIAKGEIFLYFNTDFMQKYSIKTQCDILKHEIRHIMLDHCGKRGLKFGNLNRAIKNIAMDCAINQDLLNLPESCVTLAGLEKQLNKKLIPLESWEYYYAQIEQHCKESGNVDYVVDNHEMMEEGGEIGENENAINHHSVKAAIEKAVKQCAGNVPGEVTKILGSFEKAVLPWTQLLRNFVAKARHSETKMTRTRPHRRYELDQPGKKKKRKLVLGICVDTSGSVSDNAYSSFITEIYTIAKNTSITYLVQADAKISKVDIIRGKPKKEKLNERKGYGGTAYQPAIDYCKEKNCDAIIYFGDMDAADKPKDPGVPFLWVRVGQSEPPGKFGTVLDLN